MTITPVEKTEIFSDLNEITATAANAVFRCNYAQDEADTAWSKIENLLVKWNLAPISNASCPVDTLITDCLLEDGDDLIIEKEDGSFITMVAQGVTGAGPYSMDTSAVTQGEIPSKVYKDNCVLKYAGVPMQKEWTDVLTPSWRHLFDNPSFTYNIDGWENDGSVSVEIKWDTGGSLFLNTGNPGTARTYRYPNVPLVIGREYDLYINSYGGYSSSVYVSFKKDNGDILLTVDKGVVSYSFVADFDSLYVELYLSSYFLSVYDISLRERTLQIERQYKDHALYPTVRNIEFTADIPVEGSALIFSTARMYKTAE